MATTAKHQPGTVIWLDVGAADPAKARAFYEGLFGWTFEIGGPETGGYSIALKDGKRVAGLGPLPPGHTVPSAWSVYFATEDLDATTQRARAIGAQLVTQMDILEEGRMAMLVDPTGAHFSLWQPKNHTGAQLVGEPGTMCWCEVATPDAAKARDFYGGLFALHAKSLDRSEDPPAATGAGGMEYYTLHRGNQRVGGVLQMTKEWEGVPPHWMAYFAVADCDASAKRIAELGGKVSVPPFDTPYGRIAVVNDPNGAVFSIIRLPAEGSSSTAA